MTNKNRFRTPGQGQNGIATEGFDPAGAKRHAIWSNMWVWVLLGTGYLIGQATWGKPDFTVTALFIAGPFTAAMFYARISEINSKLSHAIMLLETAVVLAEKGDARTDASAGMQEIMGPPLSRSDRRWAEAMANILRTRSDNDGDDSDVERKNTD